jgi:predicted nucleic acid-binding protein
MPVVVSDSSPLIYLTRLGHFDWLQKLFGRVIVPNAVWQEIATQGSQLPEARELAEGKNAGWIEVHFAKNSQNIDLGDLDPGEAEAIILAEQLEALLLIDEAQGRKVALSRHIRVTGTIGILLLAKARGFTPTIREHLERLLSSSTFRLSEDLYREALRRAGETNQ